MPFFARLWRTEWTSAQLAHRVDLLCDYVLLYGDFTNFVIVDRVGTTMELVPHLFGANQRPTGQRGALLWFRTGSDVVIPNAFRLLDVPTTA